MQLTKQQMRVLARSLDDAATLTAAHTIAVENSARLFEQYFCEDVPEECFTMSGGNSKNRAGTLFNTFVHYAENMTGTDKTTLELVKKINELMNATEE